MANLTSLRTAIEDYELFVTKALLPASPNLREANLDDAPKNSNDQVYYKSNILFDIANEIIAAFGTSAPRIMNLGKVERHEDEDVTKPLFTSTELSIGGHILGIGNESSMIKLKQKIESLIKDQNVISKIQKCRNEAKQLPSDVAEMLESIFLKEYRILWR